MTETRDIYLTGLRNAHAMENQALSIMKPQVSRIENYPEVARRLEQHIEETNGQIERLETILEAHGDSRSALKDLALSLGGAMAAIGHTVARRNRQEQLRQFRLRELRNCRLYLASGACRPCWRDRRPQPFAKKSR